jgi:hypothetical protein
MICLRALSFIVLMAWMPASFAQTPKQYAPQPGPSAEPAQHCDAIPSTAERLQCYKNAIPGPGAQLGAEGWRLVRTRNPDGGADAVSIMRTADFTRSDRDLAGLTIRCAATNHEVVIILVQSFPIGARLHVQLSAAGIDKEYDASIIAPGVALLLPEEVSLLIQRQWGDISELSIEVHGQGTTIRGVIPTTGLKSALQLLSANCPQ